MKKPRALYLTKNNKIKIAWIENGCVCIENFRYSKAMSIRINNWLTKVVTYLNNKTA